jgi:hypothetical protein
MMLAHCPGDPLQYLLLLLGFYGVLFGGALLAMWMFAWGMGGRDRR